MCIRDRLGSFEAGGVNKGQFLLTLTEPGTGIIDLETVYDIWLVPSDQEETSMGTPSYRNGDWTVVMADGTKKRFAGVTVCLLDDGNLEVSCSRPNDVYRPCAFFAPGQWLSATEYGNEMVQDNPVQG